jgi:hypothetical protein
MELMDRIFEIQNEDDFNKACLKVYNHQIKHCKVYGEFVDQLGWRKPEHYTEIPFLPISFFKTHDVISSEHKAESIFKSSGTGGERSRHLVASLELYEKSFLKAYIDLIGDPQEQVILALLPNYLEQGESSLVYMVNNLINRSDEQSGFVLDDKDALLDRYKEANISGKQVIIFGVSYALLDLAEAKIDLSQARIIETGGMKGRRKELTKTELHEILREGLNCSEIYSEYGMTELLSQAYAGQDMIFRSPKWMKVLIRETNDPFKLEEIGKTGGVNVIDLANIHSCSFIGTQDLGRLHENGFEIMGRFDNADLRGCNLLVQ